MGQLPRSYEWRVGGNLNQDADLLFPSTLRVLQYLPSLDVVYVLDSLLEEASVPCTSLTLTVADSQRRAWVSSQVDWSRGTPLEEGQRLALGRGKSWERAWYECQAVCCPGGPWTRNHRVAGVCGQKLL